MMYKVNICDVVSPSAHDPGGIISTIITIIIQLIVKIVSRAKICGVG